MHEPNPKIDPPEVHALLEAVVRGEEEAREALLPLLYDELRAVAGRFFRELRPDQTLQPTALVHEAYLQLAGRKDMSVENRAHFIALAATVMRRILVDHVRRRSARKRGGDRERVTMSHELEATGEPVDLLAVEEALQELARLDPRHARIVELRFYAGMTVPEVALALGVSRSTIESEWRAIRAWLARRLES